MYGIGIEVSPSSGRLQPVIRVGDSIVATFPHPNDGPVELAGGTERTGVHRHVKTDGNDDLDGLSWDTAVATVTKAIDLATAGRGDEIHIRPGDYDEAEINVNKADLAIIGHGANGAVGITPSAGIAAMKILANDVILSNIRVEGVNDASYGLAIGDFDNSPLGVRIYGCLLRNGSHATAPAVVIRGAGDLYLVGCDIAWAGVGIQFRSNTDGYPTQIFILGNKFHNLSVQHLAQFAAGGDQGKVVNLNVKGNSFDVLEAGTEPTGVWIELDHAGSTGLVEDNSFATATITATADFALAAGVHWVANKSEAGVSTARPA